MQAAYVKAPDVSIQRGFDLLEELVAPAKLQRVLRRFPAKTTDVDKVATRICLKESPAMAPMSSQLSIRAPGRIKTSDSSDEARLEKSKSQIGIEDGVPTATGVSTTLLPDFKAQESARAGAERKNARVPDDFEAVDCPSEHGGNKQARGPQSEVHPTQHQTGKGGRGEDPDGSAAEDGAAADGALECSFGRKIKELARGRGGPLGVVYDRTRTKWMWVKLSRKEVSGFVSQQFLVIGDAVVLSTFYLLFA